MKREALLQKVDNLRINGDSSFVVANNEDLYEFKAIMVNGEQFKVFGGFGSSLGVYNKHHTSEDIVRDFDSALRFEQEDIRELCIYTNVNTLRL